MDKSKRSQILKLSIITFLFIITPLIPTIFRSTYLYFIFNLLILALGTEAGLLSTFSKSDEDKKHVKLTTTQFENSNICESKDIVKPKAVNKRSSEKKVVLEAVKVNANVKKCPSTPSIFFIGNCDNVRKDHEEEREGDEAISGQELFTKAEMFIGNFYKQLKMQREDSWKGIHEFYHKAF